MTDKPEDERPKGDVGLWPETPHGPRRGLGLFLTVVGMAALAGSGLCTMIGVGEMLRAAVSSREWGILAVLPWVSIPGGAAMLVSLWMTKSGLRLRRGGND